MDNKVSNQEKEKKEIILSGRLGADAKLGESKNEKKQVLTFSVADNSDKDNVKWNNVQMWENNIPEQQLKKGDSVELKGYFKSFETSSGMKEEFVATQVISHAAKQDVAFKETIKGNLGQNPEFKKVGDKDVASFSIGFTNAKDETAWQNVQVWDKNIEKNKINELKKGDFVELKGHYGKEYETKNQEIKRDFILEESKVIKHAEKQDEKKSKGMKM